MSSTFAARPSRGRLALACAAAFAWPAAHAASTDEAARAGTDRPASAGAVAPAAPAGDTLTAVSVTAQRQPVDPDTPAVVTSITREQIESHTNVTTEDALKYAPNLMVRKR
ncbi:MAG: TonB-dependent receptor, partial [Burkholderia sp.]|nr:TonB-dependent receptor [Burkholderia sp.]